MNIHHTSRELFTIIIRLPTGSTHLIGFQPKVKAFALIPAAVTHHTTACCSMQVVDLTIAEHRSASITSLRVVQQKHCGSKYKHSFIITNQSRADTKMLPTREHLGA
jgi:hypothetical protein